MQIKVKTGALERQQQNHPRKRTAFQVVTTGHYSLSVSVTILVTVGRMKENLQPNQVAKVVCYVCQHSLQSVEEMAGDGPLHEESWTGLWKGINQTVGLYLLFCALHYDLQKVMCVHVSDQTFEKQTS